MNRPDDLDELVKAAIADQTRTRAPVDLFDRVRDATRGRSQRPPWIARTTGHHLTSPSAPPVTLRLREDRPMSGIFRIVATLAVVAIVAVGGYAVLGPRGAGTGGLPSTSPVPVGSPAPSATSHPSPMVLGSGSQESKPLEPGTYVTHPIFDFEVTLTVPAGWTGLVPGPNLAALERESGHIGVYLQQFDKVAVDPCDSTTGFRDLPRGSSVEDLVTALSEMSTIEASNAVDVTVDGYHGKHLTLTAPASFDDCTLEEDRTLIIWLLPLGADGPMAPSQRTDLWILDVDGDRLVIEVPASPDTTDDERAEAQAIFDSIRIGAPD